MHQYHFPTKSPSQRPPLQPPLRQQLLFYPLLLLLVVSAAMLGLPGAHASATTRAQPLNIIFIAVDDAGYGDFEGNDPAMNTSNIEALRKDGVFLNQSYVLPMCVPSRAAWMTGRYPHTFGLQDASVNSNMHFWLNENFTFLPRELQRLNYSTHMLGKWHLSFCHPGLTPRGRGFDSFYGFWLGSHDSYYNHTKSGGRGYDWFDDDVVDFSAKGVYQTELLNARALKIVESHDPRSNKPFFLYLSYGAPHGPFEVPEHYMDTFCDQVTNRSRRVHCGMMAAVDVGVGALVAALKAKGLYDRTLILFQSDNGGPVKSGSVNYPLRAGKKNLYEGGIRSYTMLKLAGSAHAGTLWSGLAHAVDWFPTLVRAAGGTGPDYVHGYNLYDSILNQTPSPREDFIIASDFKKFNHTMLRWRQWKLFTSVPGLGAGSKWTPGFSSGWYPPYQLLEQEVPWENVNRKYHPGQFLLYNVEQDPEERQERYEELKNEPFVQVMKNKIEEYLGIPGVRNGTYPIYPFPHDIPTAQNNIKDGVFVTCWCHPYGLPDCRNNSRNSSDTENSDTETSGGRVASLASMMATVVMMVVCWTGLSYY